MLKTEAIDFSQPFKWIDDDCLESERAVLEQNGAIDSWIRVDLNQDPRQLAALIDEL